jgi:hypothetical protein
MYWETQGAPLQDVPVLRLDGDVWMSLTPMEVQSNFMAIRLAHGRVGTGGLGLGYFVQRVLEKPEVEYVVAYELREEVLELYRRTFRPHPKLQLRHANARLLEGERWDFFYADIYRQLLTPQAIGDMVALCDANRIGMYHWWSIEQAVLEVLGAGLGHRLPDWMLNTYVPFLRAFMQRTGAESVQFFGCGLGLVEELEQRMAETDHIGDARRGARRIGAVSLDTAACGQVSCSRAHASGSTDRTGWPAGAVGPGGHSPPSEAR